MKTNKKAAMQLYALIIAFFLALTVFALTTKGPDYDINYIGESSLELISLSYNVEDAVIYAKTAAKIAADKTFYELSKKENSYDDFTNEFLRIFSTNFDNIVQNNKKGISIRSNLYVFEVKNDELNAKATNSVSLRSDDNKVTYTDDPSFLIRLPIDFNNLKEENIKIWISNEDYFEEEDIIIKFISKNS